MKEELAPVGSILPMLRRHWGKAGIVMALSMTLAIGIYSVLPNQYVASASIVVAQQDVGLETARHLSADKLGDPADLESQLLLVRSARVLRLALADPNVLAALAKECRLRPPLFPGLSCEGLGKDMDRLRDVVAQRYNVGGAGRSRVINIGYNSPDPAVAQAMANALTTTFLEDRREVLTARRVEAASQLRARLAQLETGLLADEESIQKFRRELGLQRGATGPMTAERLSGAIQALTQAETSKADAAARVTTLNQGEDFSESLSATASRTIGDLKQQLTALDAQIANESNILGPRHPVLQSLASQRAALKRRLDSEIANLAASTKRRLTSAQRTATDIASSVNKLKNEAADANDAEAKIGVLIRNADAKRVEIAEISRKIGDIEIQTRTLSTGAELVSLAELPILPFFPKRVPFLAVGLVLGLIGAVGTILLAERRRRIALGLNVSPVTEVPHEEHGDESFIPRRPDPLPEPPGPPIRRIGKPVAPRPAAPARLQVLSRLPKLQVKKPAFGMLGGAGLVDLLRAAHSDPAFGHALAELGKMLVQRGRPDGSNLVLCASTASGIGKTTSIMALADFCAAGGARVLVIEADIKRPTLADALSLKPTPGLMGVLGGAAAFGDAVARIGKSSLFVLPAGICDAGAAARLKSPAMRTVLEDARAFDLVLIDTAAERHMPVSRVLAPLADNAIIFGRGPTGESEANALAEHLARSGVRALGYVEALSNAAAGVERKRTPQRAAA